MYGGKATSNTSVLRSFRKMAIVSEDLTVIVSRFNIFFAI